MISNTCWTPNKELPNLASTFRGRGHPVPEPRDHIAMKMDKTRLLQSILYLYIVSKRVINEAVWQSSIHKEGTTF